jgi:hypothetical protein
VRAHFFGLFSLVALFVFENAIGYETETHALITRKAYQESILSQTGSNSVSHILGLDRLDRFVPFRSYWTPPGSLSDTYYTNGGWTGIGALDPTGWNVPEDFEHCQMAEFLQLDPSRAEFQLLFQDSVSIYEKGVSSDATLPIQNWLVRGAIREDDLGHGVLGIAPTLGSHCGREWWATRAQPNGANPRSFNHFYDPYLDVGLTFAGGKRSTDWAFGYIQALALPPQVDVTRENTYTYSDARNTFYWALTRQENRIAGHAYTASQRADDALDRTFLWATTFRSLGNVVHLLEDTGQPQHTRNDPHSGINSPARQAFEGYVNARILGAGDSGPYVQAFFPGAEVVLQPPPLGAYPVVNFATPVSYFTTRGSSFDSGNVMDRFGLADFTNRSFFTAGTLPGEVPETQPPQSLDDPTFTRGATNCPELAPTVDLQATPCNHYTHLLVDSLQPSYQDDLPSGFQSPNVPILSESIFSQIVTAEGMEWEYNQRKFAISVTELDAMANVTIPRAVGYAAGMLNHFFAGVGGIAISAPPSGVYAVVDHGADHSVSTQGYPCVGPTAFDGCPIFGFSVVQAQIQNAMQPVTESGTGRSVLQQMTQGTIVGVAKYHRNTCYRPDLSGEIRFDLNKAVMHPNDIPAIYPDDCPNLQSFVNGRSPYTEISVSLPISIDSNGVLHPPAVAQDINLNGSGPVLINFDFSQDTIPINATDLYFEVVFSGTIGDASVGSQEINAVAMGSVDVSEPTYNVFMNLGNYYYDTNNSSWLTVDEAQQQHLAVNANVSIPEVDICAGGSDALLTYGHGGIPAGGLEGGHALRFAAIFDRDAPAAGGVIGVVWRAPYSGVFGGVPANAGDRLFGTFATIATSTAQNPQPPYYTAHLAQASTESNSSGDFAIDAMNSGVGVTWGDNYFFFYQSNSPNNGIEQPFVPNYPLLSGSSGVFLPDPIPSSEVLLNLSLPTTCQFGTTLMGTAKAKTARLP